MQRRLIPLIWVLIMMICGWIVVSTPVVADLTVFIPRADPMAEQLLGQLRSGPTTRLILLGLSGDSATARATVSQRLVERLSTDAQFIRVLNGATLALPEAELQRLFDSRYLLSPSAVPERFTVDGLRVALQQRLNELQSPLAMLQKRWLASDPTGERFTLLQLWRGGIHEPTKRLGVWFSPDGERALLLFETRASGYDLTAQHKAVTAIRTAFTTAAQGTHVQLAMSGAGVLAVLSAERTRAQAEWLSALSTLGIVLLLAWVYRSPQPVGLSALPLLAALLVGAAAVDLLFGKMYLITLGFSMTLLGETLDYPTYLFSHRRNTETVAETLRYLWPTLRLCIATTTLGCLAMLDADFPGLSQLGVFTIAGVLAAAATTRWLLPTLLSPTWIPQRPLDGGAWLEILLRPHPRLALVFGGSGLLVLLILIVKAPALWENDLAALSPVPSRLLHIDQSLRSDLGAPEVGHLIVITAPDAETALRHSEIVAAYLEAHHREGLLSGYDGAMRYLPSQATQRQRQAHLPESGPLAEHLAAALQGLPFKAGLFTPFLDAVAAAKTASPLRPEDVQNTLIGTRINALLFPSASGWTALLPLSGVQDAQALAAHLPQDEASHADYLDLRTETNRLIAGFRDTALQRMVWGSVLIVAVVWIGLRSWRATLAALMPVAIALIFTVAALLALGERLSLFHLVSLLLVLGVGVDYGLFFSRPTADSALRRHTLYALLICCGSALLVFGMLAFSELPALRAMGLTVSLGVAASFSTALATARPYSTKKG